MSLLLFSRDPAEQVVRYFGHDERGRVVDLADGRVLAGVVADRGPRTRRFPAGPSTSARPGGPPAAAAGPNVFVYRGASELGRPVRFQVSTAVIDAIDAAGGAENDGRLTSVETGGFLFAHGSDLRFVRFAVAAYTDASRDSVRLDAAAAAHAVDGLRGADGLPFTAVGTWHSHPGGIGEPSEADLALAADHLAGGILDVELMLIAVPADFGGHQLHGWAIRERACGGFKAEPALLEQLDEPW